MAALLMDAMIGGSGMIVYQDGYLRGVWEIFDRHGIALIFDEAMTGSARPGANVLWAGLAYSGHPLACAAGCANLGSSIGARRLEGALARGTYLMAR